MDLKQKYLFLQKKYIEDLDKLENLSRIVAERYEELVKLQEEIDKEERNENE